MIGSILKMKVCAFRHHRFCDLAFSRKEWVMKVGPINAVNKFPIWYKDRNGLRLQLKTNPKDPYSLISLADLPNPEKPVAFPDNFPGEVYYYVVKAEMETGTGERAYFEVALVAGFENEIPVDGEQTVFGRLRIHITGLKPNGKYTVTHPYGVNTFIAKPIDDEVGEIRFTEEIGGMNGEDFGIAPDNSAFPFVQWDTNIAPQAPIGYIGDPNVPHPVIGSIMIDRLGEMQNFFRIEGPEIGVNSPHRATTIGINPDHCIETRDFLVVGKISIICGMEVVRTTYSQSEQSRGFIDVFAIADESDQVIGVTGRGIILTKLEGENEQYFARVAYEGEYPPSMITVTNISDNDPASIVECMPIDSITAIARYDNNMKILTIKATSSDELHPIELVIEDFGHGDLQMMSGEEIQITTLSVPATLTIVSSAGGSRIIPVSIGGGETLPSGVVANAGRKLTVMMNARVMLDGTGSTGPVFSYRWKQTAGIPVTLENSDTATPSFKAPNAVTVLIFKLMVEGEGSVGSDYVTVDVTDQAPAPVANAGQNQTVQQDSTVILKGSSRGLVSTFRWKQLAGTSVEITNASLPTAKFIFPKELTTLIFEYTVSGPGGSSSDTVEISTVKDRLTVTLAEFSTDESQWRVFGTTNVKGPGVKITIFTGNTLDGVFLGEVEVDEQGVWEYQSDESSEEPDETRAISIQSSSGGALVNVPITVRD